MTCRHFRRSVAAQVGYCGLDRRRTPLVGDEIRACWEAGAAPDRPTLPAPVMTIPAAAGLDFIEVDAPASGAATGSSSSEPVFDPPAQVLPAEPRWSLWSELEA